MNRPTQTLATVLCSIAAVVPLSTSPVQAESPDLAAVMPEGSLVYVGWSGCDAVAGAFESTALGKTLAEPQVKRLIDHLTSVADKTLRAQSTRDGQQQVYEAAKRVLLTLAQRPTALALVDAGFGEQGPMVKFAVVSKVGDKGETFLADVHTILQGATMIQATPVTVAGADLHQLVLPAPGGLYYGLIDGHFVLALNSATVEDLVKGIAGAGSSLAQSDRLAGPRKRIGGDDTTRAVTVFLDVEGLLARARTLLPIFAAGQPDMIESIDKTLGAIGLDSIQAVCWELHHRSGGCYNGLYVSTKGKRSGLLSLHTDTALTDADLAWIPKHPTFAWAANIDLGGLYRSALGIVRALNVDAHAEIVAAIAKLEDNVGFRFDEGFLDLIGDTIIVYDAEENGGIWFTGLTKIVETSDPDRLRASLRKLVLYAATELGDDAGIAVAKTTYGKHTIEYVNITGVPAPVAPAWAVVEGRMIFALYPQMVMTALDRMDHGGGREASILANPDVVAARKVLGEFGPVFSYTDTKGGVAGAYTIMLPLAQVGAAMAQGEGIPLDISTFPTQQALTRHLFAHVGTARIDAGGVLYAAHGPLPGVIPALASGSSVEVPLMVSVLLPSLSRARARSKRLVSAVNLKGIGTCCHIYAHEHEGAFPPDLQAQLDEQCITTAHLVSPNDDTQADSFVYLAGQTTGSNPRNVLAHERTDINYGEGVNVLFVDGYAEFMKLPSFERALAATMRRLGEQ